MAKPQPNVIKRSTPHRLITEATQIFQCAADPSVSDPDPDSRESVLKWLHWIWIHIGNIYGSGYRKVKMATKRSGKSNISIEKEHWPLNERLMVFS